MKGSVSLVGEAILIVILVSVLIPFVYYSLASMRGATGVQGVILSNYLRKAGKNFEINWSSNTLSLCNLGSNEEVLTYIGVENDGKTVLLNISSIESITLKDGSYILNGLLHMPPGSCIDVPVENGVPAFLVTYDGVVYPISKYIISSQVATTAASLQVKPVVFMADDLQKLLSQGQVYIDPSLISEPTRVAVENGVVGGMYRLDGTGSYPLVLVKKFENVPVNIYAGLFGQLISGYSPAWLRSKTSTPRFSLYLTGGLFEKPRYMEGDAIFEIGGCKFKTNIWGLWEDVSGGACSISDEMLELLEGSKRGGWVIKILDFEPETDEDGELDIAIRYYYFDRSTGKFNYRWFNDTNAIGKFLYGGFDDMPDTLVKMKGIAREVKIYMLDTSLHGKQSSYEPYIFIADTDGNGYPELSFVTLNIGYSHVGNAGDTAKYSTRGPISCGFGGCSFGSARFVQIDWSDQPVIMRFDKLSVVGTQYTMIEVSIRFYFHDNLGDDIEEVENSDYNLFGVYLIDVNESYKIVGGQEWSYQQLAPLEDTFPPNLNFVTFNVPLLVPNTNHTYVVAVRFWDPYMISSYGIDDGEFIMSVEFIGITYYTRG